MIRFSIYSLAGILTIFVLVNFLLNKKIHHYKKLDNKTHFLSSSPSIKEIPTDTLSHTYHFYLLSEHFKQPFFEETPFGFKYRPDDNLKTYYRSLTSHQDSSVSEIGYYGLCIIYFYLDKYNDSFFYLENVYDKKAPDIQNISGYRAFLNHEFLLAEKLFLSEINSAGNIEGAHYHLVELWERSGDFDKIYRYSLSSEKRKYVSERQLEEANLRLGNYVDYFLSTIKIETNLPGTLAAIIISLVWSIYLFKINVFKKHPWGLHILFFLLGSLFSMFTPFFYDIFYTYLNFTLNGHIINDFLFCVFGIGAIEELIKILPLILFLLATKIEDPIDYIIYAGASALGFAFMENLLYFKEGQSDLYDGRAFVSVISHLFDSSIIAYGLILAKFRYQKNQIIYFFLFYFIACLSHGFYDFWLLNKTVQVFKLYTIIYMLVSMLILTSFINNALNNSPYFKIDPTFNTNSIKKYLLTGLIGISMFEYTTNGFLFGAEVANNKLYGSIFFVGFFALFLSGNLSNFDLARGHWGRINIADFKRKLHYNKVIGKKIRIENSNTTQNIKSLLPLIGTIINRQKFIDESDHLIINMETPIKIGNKEHSHILVRSQNDDQLIGTDKNVKAFFLIQKSEEGNVFELKDKQELKFIDWVNINPLKNN